MASGGLQTSFIRKKQDRMLCYYTALTISIDKVMIQKSSSFNRKCDLIDCSKWLGACRPRSRCKLFRPRLTSELRKVSDLDSCFALLYQSCSVQS